MNALSAESMCSAADYARASAAMSLPLAPFAAAAGVLNTLAEAPLGAVDYLDALYETDDALWYGAKWILTRMTSEALLGTYGSEVLAWAAANTADRHACEDFVKMLHTAADYDEAIFTRSRLWWWQKLGPRRTRSMLLQYALGDAVLHGGLESIEVPALVRESALPGVEVSSKRASAYSLQPATPAKPRHIMGYMSQVEDPVWPNVRYRVYVDTPVGAVLAYKGRPQAVMGLGVCSTRELMIYQLQGVQGEEVDPALHRLPPGDVVRRLTSRGLAPLDWRCLLVEVARNLAQGLGLTSLGLQTGAKNYWATNIEPGETAPHLTPEAAYHAYDVPAQRLGFTQGVDKNWHQQV